VHTKVADGLWPKILQCIYTCFLFNLSGAREPIIQRGSESKITFYRVT